MKDTDIVFASVVKNDEVLKRDTEIVEQLLDPRKMEQSESPDFSLPEITSIEDVYENGVICDARVFKDEKNLYMPYILNLFPKERALMIHEFEIVLQALNPVIQPL